MEKKITESQRRRLDRNAKIKERYKEEVALYGKRWAIVADIAKSYKITIPTVYSIIKER